MKRIEKIAKDQIEKDINLVWDSIYDLSQQPGPFHDIFNNDKFGITLTHMHENREIHTPVSIIALFEMKVFRKAVIDCLLDEYVSKEITSLLEK